MTFFSFSYVTLKRISIICHFFVTFRYPSQKEWQRKEQLYLKIIDYFDKDKQWEHAIPLCKELCELYEKKVFDYAKLSGILRKQAGLFEKVISSNEEGLRFDPEYFRVGFYGQGFPLFLRVSLFLNVMSYYSKIYKIKYPVDFQ